MKKLLFEIGTEEMPANYMPIILNELHDLAAKKMDALRIPYKNLKVYGTPRRMAFIAEEIPEAQADSSTEFKGPSAKIAFGPDGKPTKAALGFARGKGVAPEDLVVKDNYIYAVKHVKGAQISALLPGLLQDILTSLTFPTKNMRWADFDFKFIRPVRWLVALFGTDVVPVAITDIKSGRKTMGHRFLSKGELEIASADDYVKVLEDHFVMVDQDKRRAEIKRQVEELAQKEGGKAQIPADLLEEVNYLVEYPTALCGKFDEKFLALPKAAIITPMRDHQRYFPVLGKDGKLLNKFITIRNGGSEHLEVVASGNERVLKARLSDAEFFFNEDRKIKLADRLEKIKKVVFQEGMGSMYDKSLRLINILGLLNTELHLPLADADLNRAATLSKADLVTGMVTEFTELQGTMGKEYALLDGEKPEVAQAIEEQYEPRFAGDKLPQSELGSILSIADKLDNIVATFSRGLAPTGSQDPYALRRQALGIINILIERQYHLSLQKVISGVFGLFSIAKDKQGAMLQQILDFIKLRFKNMLLDQGVRYDIIDAVLQSEGNTDDIYDLYLKINALKEFLAKPEAAAMIQAAVRVNNLCSKAQKDTVINDALFHEEAEKVLYKETAAADKKMIPALIAFNYGEVLKMGCGLVAPVNKFFDDVMVMDKDEKVKNNRLALLVLVHDILNAAGNLSALVL
jgi:glycyl-tRNA synthetase beta chain